MWGTDLARKKEGGWIDSFRRLWWGGQWLTLAEKVGRHGGYDFSKTGKCVCKEACFYQNTEIVQHPSLFYSIIFK
jgi:hypothetical protein